VVVCPARKGKAPHIPQPVAPKNSILHHSNFICFVLFFKDRKLKINKMKKTIVHLQNASDIGGTYSTPPLATTKLLAMKMG
tara:strand:- start:804 stop:1046 length:243 start_codon:yes stop_codon:yes gene_type:complete